MELAMDDNFDDIDGKPSKKPIKIGAFVGSLAPIALILLTIIYILILDKTLNLDTSIVRK